MKLKFKHFTYYIIACLTLSSCSPFMFDSYQKSNCIRVFENSKNKISLKKLNETKAPNSEDIITTFSYIIYINEPREKNLTVYLYLMDEDGFQIRDKIFISRISENFSGMLRGNFTFPHLFEYEKICGAELFFMIN